MLQFVYACYCCVRFSILSTMPRGWLGRTSLKWPILCRVGRTTLTQSAGDICWFKPLMTIHWRVRIANDEYKCRMVYAKVHVHHDQGVPFTGFRQSADLWDSLFDCREIAWNMAKHMTIVLFTVAFLWILVLEITECLIIFLRTTTTASYTMIKNKRGTE